MLARTTSAPKATVATVIFEIWGWSGIRRNYLSFSPGAERAPSSALPSTRAMQTFVSHIAWEAEVWIPEDPDHTNHFNGEVSVSTDRIRT